MDEPQLVVHMRKIALDAALKHVAPHHHGPAEVIAVATQFYNFLKGDNQ